MDICNCKRVTGKSFEHLNTPLVLEAMHTRARDDFLVSIFSPKFTLLTIQF